VLDFHFVVDWPVADNPTPLPLEIQLVLLVLENRVAIQPARGKDRGGKDTVQWTPIPF
jgi:hypothetical protein